MRGSKKRYAVLALTIPLAIYIFTLSSHGGQAATFIALQSAIVQNHTLAISRNGSDTIQFSGRNYIVYAPGFSFLSLPFGAIGIVLDGPRAEFPAFAYLMDELCLALAASISSLLVYEISLLYTRESKNISLLTALTFAFATGVWPFSVQVYPHVLSMSFALLSVYLVLIFVKGKTRRESSLLVFAGLAIGSATFIEYAAGLFIVPLTLYLIFAKHSVTTPSPKRSLGIASFLGVFAVVGVGLNFLYNYELFGNPLVFPQAVYVNGVHFYLAGLASHALFYLISPYRGVIFYSPVLLVGFYGLYRMLRTSVLRQDALLYLSLFGSVVVFYSGWQDWAGGIGTYGPRFLTLGLPFLAIPVSICLFENRSRTWRACFFTLFVVSSLIEGIGAISNSSAVGDQNVLEYVPLTYSLPRIIEGKFSVWWTQWFGLTGLTTVVDSLASVFVLIWLIGYYLSFKNLPRHAKMPSNMQVEVESRSTSDNY